MTIYSTQERSGGVAVSQLALMLARAHRDVVMATVRGLVGRLVEEGEVYIGDDDKLVHPIVD